MGSRSLVIRTVFIPVPAARYSLGDIYDGKRIKDELALRQAVNRDSDESLNIYAMIMSHGQKILTYRG